MILLRSQCDLLALHRLNPERYPHLLESVAVSGSARYSILFAFPGKQLQACFDDKDFLSQLDQWFETEYEAKPCPYKLPFCGGWFLFLAYELAADIEPTLVLPADPLSLPKALAVRFPCAVIVDHKKHLTHIVCEHGYENEASLIQLDIQALSQKNHSVSDNLHAKKINLMALQEAQAAQYLTHVAAIRDYIYQGDVFQVNISRVWQAILEQNITPADIYSLLRLRNPAPFAALANFTDFSIISSSPERLVCVKDGIVETRPIAGTHRRGTNTDEDKALAKELVINPKECAEHIMLIDLERNDLGRICQPGSVKVDELMVVESYQHVHHIVSNVRGHLRQGISPGDVIRAVFPGGTITGCPKVRCMEIIAELEAEGRGVYTGSIGYLNRNGQMDLNILIRSMVQKQQQLSFRTGAGIVMDSVAEKELKETRYKAEGLLRVFKDAKGKRSQ